MIFAVTTTEKGMVEGPGPLDSCKTPAPPGPPVPMPYPNMAQLQQAVPASCALKVTVRNKPIFHKGSKIPMSSGDEPGSVGGVVSGVIKGPAKPMKASAKVKVEGQAAVFLTCQFQLNGSSSNLVGIHDQPSQDKVTVKM